MDLEEQIAAYKKLTFDISALEEKKRALAQEILAMMPDAKFETKEYKASRYRRLQIATSIEQARALHATKIEEILDKEKLKELFYAGVAIEGIEELSYLMVSVKRKVED